VTNGFDQHIVIYLVKKCFDIKVNHKVVIEAVATRLFNSIMTTFLWAIPKPNKQDARNQPGLVCRVLRCPLRWVVFGVRTASQSEALPDLHLLRS
jgi:hypothetical protein